MDKNTLKSWEKSLNTYNLDIFDGYACSYYSSVEGCWGLRHLPSSSHKLSPFNNRRREHGRGCFHCQKYLTVVEGDIKFNWLAFFREIEVFAWKKYQIAWYVDS